MRPPSRCGTIPFPGLARFGSGASMTRRQRTTAFGFSSTGFGRAGSGKRRRQSTSGFATSGPAPRCAGGSATSNPDGTGSAAGMQKSWKRKKMSSDSSGRKAEAALSPLYSAPGTGSSTTPWPCETSLPRLESARRAARLGGGPTVAQSQARGADRRAARGRSAPAPRLGRGDHRADRRRRAES